MRLISRIHNLQTSIRQMTQFLKMYKRHKDKLFLKKSNHMTNKHKNMLNFINNQGNVNWETHETGKEGLIIPSGGKMCTDKQKPYTLMMGVKTDKAIWKTCWRYLVNISTVYPTDQRFHFWDVYIFSRKTLVYLYENIFFIKV